MTKAAVMENAEWAFAAYEAARHRLPAPDFTEAQARAVGDLSDLADDIDLYFKAGWRKENQTCPT